MINIKMQHQVPQINTLAPKIAVIGVGGAGGNAVNNMISSNLDGCDFLVCNTDAQALQGSLCENRIQLGVNITGGLGAGSKPEVGKAAAEESLEEVLRYLDGANMAFVTAGMGGGTGTGAAPVIAKACREQGILTVGVVTKPFHFEGAHRMEQAEKGIAEMQQYVDTLIVIPNQNLFRVANEKTTFAEAFKMADSVLQSGVRGVTDLMVRPGMINLDFADIRTAMQQMGKAMMGTGEASGEKRAVEAAEAAINNPLLDDVSMKGAEGVIINVTGGYDMTLFEADEACNRIRDEVDPKANIIFGATFDESLEGVIRVSIVATGIENGASKAKYYSGGGNGGGHKVETPQQNTQDVSSAQSSAAAAVSAQPAVQNAPRPQVAASSSLAATMMRPMVSVPSDRYEEAAETAPVTGRDALRHLKAPAPIAPQTAQVKAPDIFSAPRPSSYHTQEQRQKPQETAPAAPTSLDMFEQGEFSQGEELYAPQNTILRGTTYKESFIPPKPMEPDMAVPENGIGAHISGFHAQHAPERAQARPAESSSLVAPKPSQDRAPQLKKAPSLFERITGSVQQRIDNFRDDGDLAAPAQQPAPQRSYAASGNAAPAMDSRPLTSSRPSLNMASPAGKPGVKIDDELDIPAFLRRQAN